jgi:hypothetical protein
VATTDPHAKVKSDAALFQDPVVILLILFLATAVVALIVPFIWHANLYVDGRQILNTVPDIGLFVSSYNSAAWFLHPLISIASVFGGAGKDYGTTFDLDFFVTNFAFGWAFLGGIALLLFALRKISRAVPIVITLVLLTPFMYNVSKELIFFLPCIVAVRAGIRRRDLATQVDLRLIILLVCLSGILLGVFFRAYYVLFALILLINVALAKWRRLVTAYIVLAILCILIYRWLPLDQIAVGRAYYLEGVSNTRLTYPFPDDGGVNFLLNRTVTLGQLIFPVGLSLLSLSYIPFVLFQLFCTYRMFQGLWGRLGELHRLAAHIVLAFTVTQALFEPDFGSYFRHKVAILPFFLILIANALRQDPDVIVRRWHRPLKVGART